MKIHKEPIVEIVASTQIDAASLEQYLARNGFEWHDDDQNPTDADKLPEFAGRLCYTSFGGKAGRKGPDYLDHIKEVGHGSVVEHVSFSYSLAGISRTLTHELVRHRAGWAYSQLSQRYVASEDAEMVMPPTILTIADAEVRESVERDYIQNFKDGIALYEKTVKFLMQESSKPENLFRYALQAQVFQSDSDDYPTEYQHQTENGVGDWCTEADWVKTLADKSSAIREDVLKRTRTMRRKDARSTARACLPNSTETKICATANGRALRHFFEMRGNRAAEIEIRRLAIAMWRKVKPLAPWLFSDYEWKSTDDGIGCLVTKYPKV